MRKYLYIGLLLLLFTPRASAQFTLVNGTVTDTGGLAYACGTISASIVNLNGQSLYLNGAQFSPNPSATKLGCPTDPTTSRTAGAFSVQLADNTQIKCGSGASIITCATQTQWLFTINTTGSPPPLGTGPQVCTSQNTISGTSQTINIAGCPSLANVATNVAVTPTINAIYASPSCPASATNCFAVNNDVQVTTNAIYSAGSTTVGTQTTDPAFVSSDANKGEFGTFNCPGTVSNCNDNCPQGTISSVTDAHHVVVSIACTNTSSAGANTNNWFWGHDDATQLTAAFNVILTGSGSANSQRQNLFLPCGMMFMGTSSFIIPSGIRNINGGITGCGGGGATVIVPLPKMNCNTTGGCLFADNSLPLENQGSNLPGWVVKDITFWGGGTDLKDPGATYSNPATGILTNIFDTLYDVFVIGWVWNNGTPVIGMQSNGSNWHSSGAVAAGTINCQLAGTVAVPASMYGGQCGGSFALGTNSMKVVSLTGFRNIVTTEGVYFNQGGIGVTNAGASDTSWFSHGDNITNCFNQQSGTTFLSGTQIDQFSSGCPILSVSGGAVHLNAVSWRSTGTTFSITGGTVFDDCGVSVPTTGTAGTFTGGTVLGNCSMPDLITNPSVASRNTSLVSTAFVPAIRLPYTGPMTVKLYAYDSAAGSGCTGNTTVTWTISYTDNTGTAQTQTATETITTNGGATGGDKLGTSFTFSTNGVTAVNYSTTYAIGTGCVTGPSYAAQLSVT